MYPSTWHVDSTKILTRRELAAVTRYEVEQGIIDRQLSVEELFAPSTLSLSKV